MVKRISNFRKAKRGDLALVELKHSSTGNVCAGVKSSSSVDYQFGKVTSTDRAGLIRTVTFHDGSTRQIRGERTYLLGQGQDLIWQQLGSETFFSLQAAQAETKVILQKAGLMS